MRVLSKATVVVLSLVIGLAGSFGASVYYKGSSCEEQAKCTDCLAGRRHRPSDCPNAPYKMCVVVKSRAQDNAQFAHCVKDANAKKPCEAVLKQGDPVAQCTKMDVWYCGCYSSSKGCNLAACNCQGRPDETNRTHDVNAVCVQDPVDPGVGIDR